MMISDEIPISKLGKAWGHNQPCGAKNNVPFVKFCVLLVSLNRPDELLIFCSSCSKI